MTRLWFLAKKSRTSDDVSTGAFHANAPTSSVISLIAFSTILHNNNFLLCFNVFIGCWCAGPSRTDMVINTLPHHTTLYATELENLIVFFAQNLIEIFRWVFLDSKKSPSTFRLYICHLFPWTHLVLCSVQNLSTWKYIIISISLKGTKAGWLRVNPYHACFFFLFLQFLIEEQNNLCISIV